MDVESHKSGVETSRIAVRFNSSFLTPTFKYSVVLSTDIVRYLMMISSTDLSMTVIILNGFQ